MGLELLAARRPGVWSWGSFGRTPRGPGKGSHGAPSGPWLGTRADGLRAANLADQRAV